MEDLTSRIREQIAEMLYIGGFCDVCVSTRGLNEYTISATLPANRGTKIVHQVYVGSDTSNEPGFAAKVALRFKKYADKIDDDRSIKA
jgi:hypothetical protein